MPKSYTWNEVVAASKQGRLARLDARAIEAAILLADKALQATERAAEGATTEDTDVVPIVAEVPVQRGRRAVKRVDDA